MEPLCGLCRLIEYPRLSLLTVLHVDTVFHCLLGTILQIKQRMFATWEFDVPEKRLRVKGRDVKCGGNWEQRRWEEERRRTHH